MTLRPLTAKQREVLAAVYMGGMIKRGIHRYSWRTFCKFEHAGRDCSGQIKSLMTRGMITRAFYRDQNAISITVRGAQELFKCV